MIALDTNLLVHAHRRDASYHEEARECLRIQAESAAPWAICYHSLVEFYGIASHTRIWEKPSSPQQVADQLEAWLESPSLRVLTDQPEEISRLMNLAVEARIRGGMIHDARIASCCLAHGVQELWTLDRDFSRFTKLKTRNPLAPSSGTTTGHQK